MYCVLQTFANNDRRFLDPQKLCRTWTPRLKIPTLRKRIPPFIRDVTGRGTLQFTMHTPCPCKAGGAPSGPRSSVHTRVFSPCFPLRPGWAGGLGSGALRGLCRAHSWELGGWYPAHPTILVSFPLPSTCQSVINSSKTILFPASKWRALSATPQNTSLMFSRGWGRGNKIVYLPEAMFTELKSIDSPWDSLLFPSEWIFKFGTQVAFRLNGPPL